MSEMSGLKIDFSFLDKKKYRLGGEFWWLEEMPNDHPNKRKLL